MLTACAKTLWKCQPLKHTHRVLALQNYATFTARDIIHETSDEAGTLLNRFAKHIALERQKICDLVPTNVKYPDYFPVSDVNYFQKELQKTSKDQIASVIIFAFTYRSNADPSKFAIIINELDRFAVRHVAEMNADTILRTLYAFLFLLPNWMTRLDFYGRAMQRLCEEYDKQEIRTKEMFVQLCFYMGLSKKQTQLNVNNIFASLLDSHLGQHIHEMNTLDLALVSNAAYKTSVVIKNEDFNQRLLKEVLEISDTSHGYDSLLVTFIKSMRLQRLRSSKVCEYIENICQDTEKLQQLQTIGQVHLFAYLAENLWDNKHCLEPLIETITKNISPFVIRGKDISTFLWSCAQLNCSLSPKQFQSVENSLLQKFNAGEFKYYADQLVDSCLCLWILGYKKKELFNAALKVKSESTNNRKQPKVDSRLTVLLSAAKIEEPAFCSNIAKDFEAFNLTAKIPAHISSNQDIPYKKIIEELLKIDTVASANISCPINGINILGIHVNPASSTQSEVFLEFKTPAQTLHFSQEPVAILRLKLRLLQSLGHKVKLVPSAEVLNPENLKNVLAEDDVQVEDLKEPSKSSINA